MILCKTKQNILNSNEDIYGKGIFQSHHFHYIRDHLSINKAMVNATEVKHNGWSGEIQLDCCAIVEYQSS